MRREGGRGKEREGVKVTATWQSVMDFDMSQHAAEKTVTSRERERLGPSGDYRGKE